MSKRLTDTEIWQKEWFLKYTLKQKVLFRFILDNCDCAGVYEPNYTLLNVYIGEVVTREEILSLNQDKMHIEELENGKFFIPDFVFFQCGELKETCKPHAKVIETLKKHGLFERVSKGYVKGIDTLEEYIEIKNRIDKKGGAGGKQEPVEPILDCSKVPEDWKEVFEKWVSYRNKIKKPFKTQESFDAQFRKLKSLSSNSLDAATEIVENSIAEGWQGLFKLKENTKDPPSKHPESHSIYSQQLKGIMPHA